MKLIFFGPPGSGKGTLAGKMVNRQSYHHLSTGDIFRQAIKEQTELGTKVKSIIDQGGLVPDELTIALVKDHLEDLNHDNMILDGFPRTVPQAEALQGFWKIDRVINLILSKEEIVVRLGGRRICPNCGGNFHVVSIKPAKEGICDHCGTALIRREDDKKDAILKRLEIYETSSAPVLDFYRKQQLVLDIDASGSPEENYEKLIALLG